MDKRIERDSDDMRAFSTYLQYFSEEAMYYASDLRCNCSISEEHMQDESGQDALNIITNLAENILSEAYAARALSERLLMSAKLIEESDECI